MGQREACSCRRLVRLSAWSSGCTASPENQKRNGALMVSCSRGARPKSSKAISPKSWLREEFKAKSENQSSTFDSHSGQPVRFSRKTRRRRVRLSQTQLALVFWGFENGPTWWPKSWLWPADKGASPCQSSCSRRDHQARPEGFAAAVSAGASGLSGLEQIGAFARGRVALEALTRISQRRRQSNRRRERDAAPGLLRFRAEVGLI